MMTSSQNRTTVRRRTFRPLQAVVERAKHTPDGAFTDGDGLVGELARYGQPRDIGCGRAWTLSYPSNEGFDLLLLRWRATAPPRILQAIGNRLDIPRMKHA
jgi:hypothetical protein